MSDETGNPALQGRRLRAVLRQARRDAGLTQEQAAAALDWSLSKIVRIETGSVRVTTTDLRALLGLYNISDADQVSHLVAMAKEARQRPWWLAYKEVAPKGYFEYVEFEHAARATLNFQPLVVPGILQTREYATACVRRLSSDLTQERAAALLELRMRRQQLLEQADPATQSFVVDESVLYRPVASAEVMHAQFSRLIELAARPTITIQVLPFAAGPARGMQTSFVVHKLADEADFDVLYLDGPLGEGITAYDRAVVRRFVLAFEELQQIAFSPADTLTVIKELQSTMQ